MTSIAYFRIYWKFVVPERGKYNWEMLDRAWPGALPQTESHAARGSVRHQ